VRWLSKLFKKKSCTNHPDKKGVGYCRSCGKYFCPECLSNQEGYYYCLNEKCNNQKYIERKNQQTLTEAEHIIKNLPSLFDAYVKAIYYTMTESFPNFTPVNEEYVNFEIGAYLYFRIDFQLHFIKSESKYRDYVKQSCEMCLSEYIGAFDDILARLLDTRIIKYTEVANDFNKYSNDFFFYIYDLAFGLMKRASLCKTSLEWDQENYTLPLSGLVEKYTASITIEEKVVSIVNMICGVNEFFPKR
jgi:hypothetical protein